MKLIQGVTASLALVLGKVEAILKTLGYVYYLV